MAKWVVVYDIPDDKRRKKLSDLLENFGDRVQYSVFEVIADESELAVILKKIEDVLETKEDSVRLYPLCQACSAKVVVKGVGETQPWPEPDVYVV